MSMRPTVYLKLGTNFPKPLPMTIEEIASAIQAAPERIHDPECPYDPNDPDAVEAFWKGSRVRRSGPEGESASEGRASRR